MTECLSYDYFNKRQVFFCFVLFFVLFFVCLFVVFWDFFFFFFFGFFGFVLFLFFVLFCFFLHFEQGQNMLGTLLITGCTTKTLHRNWAIINYDNEHRSAHYVTSTFLSSVDRLFGALCGALLIMNPNLLEPYAPTTVVD